MGCSAEHPPVEYNGAPRGITIAGGEFGAERRAFSNQNPGRLGTDYIYNSERTIRWFASQGISIFRIPFRWERLQPELGGPLNTQEFRALRENVEWVNQSGGRAVLDLHNYARFFYEADGIRTEAVVGHSYGGKVLVSRSNLADLWVKLGRAFAKETHKPWAYGLMNEPHHIDGSLWKSISQHVVSSLRAAGDKTFLLVPGSDWSSAERWGRVHGQTAWIDDPENHFAYEAHVYFDWDGSGEYLWSWEEELAKDSDIQNRAKARLSPFIDWCAKNKVQGFIGEFGVPSHLGWRAVLSQALALMDQARMQGCYWAAGEWWGTYPLSIQPDKTFSTRPVQLDWLTAQR